MAIPSSLQRKLDQYEADDKAAQAAGEGEQQQAAASATSPEQTEQQQNVQTEQAQQEATTVAADEGAEAQAQQATEAETQQQQTATQEQPDANYKRMEGRYKAQIQRLEAQIAELKEQAKGASGLVDLLTETRRELAAAQRELAELKAGKPQQQAAPADPEVPELTADELELYSDFAPVAEKLVKRATAPLIKKLTELESRNGDVDKRFAQTDETLFVRDVRSRVPDFDRIANSAEWQEFIKRPVPFTGISIGDALMQAHNARDLNRVAGIFDAFSSEHAPAAAATTTTVTTEQTPAAAKPAGIEQFVTPSRTAANKGAPTPKFRDGDYRARLNDMRSGRITKQEFLKFETEFNEAQRAGLVAT